MNHLGITLQDRERKRIQLKNKTDNPGYLFLAACLLPLLIYGLYYFDVFSSAAKISEFVELEKSTALVNTGTGAGTAFLISEDKLLTAKHVVDDLQEGSSVTLLFKRAEPEITTTATVEWIDPTPAGANVTLDYFLTDLAVLRLDNPSVAADLLPLDLGVSADIGSLSSIIVIGYPGGDFSVTKGNINSDTYQDTDLFKIDAASNPGNSGGPVIDEETQTVIGMLVGGNSELTQGSNIANKSDNILGLLENAGVVW